MNHRHRLRGRSSFAAVRRSGTEARSGLVRARATCNGTATARAGIAVTGARHAVERNRARRRIRGLLRAELAPMTGVDLVVTAPVAVNQLSAETLALDIRTALHAVVAGCTQP